MSDAAAPAVPETPRFSVGQVLGDSFSVLGQNFVPYVVLGLIGTAPELIVQLVGQPEFFGVDRDSVWLAAPDLAVYFAVNLAFSFAVTAMVTYATIAGLRGRRVGIGETVAHAMRVLLPVLGVSILSSLGLVLGFFVFVIPAFILLTMWWVAVPVVVVERTGVIAAFRRSSDLTVNNRGRIFGLVILLSIVENLASIPVDVIVRAGWSGQDAALPTAVGDWLLSGIVLAFTAIVTSVSYYSLRIAREGLGVGEIAAIFD